MDLLNKRVGIIGLGMRTGVVSARTLTNLGAHVVVSDVKPASELREELAQLAEMDGIELDLGGHTEKVLDVDLLVLSPGVPVDIPIIQEGYRRGLEIISEIELSYRLSKAPFIAITGTNGKTTTTSLVGHLLQSYPNRVFVGGNIGRTLIGEVLNLSAKDVVIAEVSSFQLETVERFHPEIALFLNITPDHLDRHKTMEAYLKAKMNIFINQTPNDYLILNADDPILREIAKKAPSKIIWFSRFKTVQPGLYLDDEMLINHLADKPQEILSIRELKIRGAHNVENALAAIGVALLKGISVQQIRDGLRSFPGQEHTLEFVLSHEGVQYYNDSKGTNPDATLKALKAFKEPIILIAGGLSRGLDFGPLMDVAVEKAKALFLLGETKEEIRKVALEQGFSGQIQVVEDLKSAVLGAYNASERGDVILLSPACASWDMFTSYVQRGRLFKEYVRELTNQ